MSTKEKKGEGKTDSWREVEVMDLPFPKGQATETELQIALEEADRHQRETLALLNAARAVMAHEHFAEAAREIFDHCREVIGAPSGYVSLSNEEGTVNELVFLESGGLACTVDPDLPMPIRGLRAEAYETGEGVYDNDFPKSDHVKFLPAGHVTLENILFAPLKTTEQKTVGLLGLANKPGGFTDSDACLAAGFAEIAAVSLVSKKAGEALKESEEKYRNIIETAPVGIFKSTPEGKFLEVNPALAGILGYDSPHDLIETVNKTNIADQLYVDPELRPKVVNGILHSRDWYTYENEYRQKNGRVITASVKFRSLQTPDGITTIEGFVEDVTERKETEETLLWELAVNAALARLYEPLVSPSSSILEISLCVLEQTKDLTGSEHGYVSTIDPITRDMVCYTHTEMMLGQCEVEDSDRRIVFPRGQNGVYPHLWGHALNTCEAFFTNSPAAHPSFSRVPPGHIPIYRFLSVPVLLGEELVGQIALANPGRDYMNRDLDAVKRLGEFFALAIQRKRFEDELEKARDHLEIKVKQRTADLVKSNVQLMKEMSEREKFEEELIHSEQKLRDLTSQLLNAQEEERRRLSRELHDDLGQFLMVLKLKLKSLDRDLGIKESTIQKAFEQLSYSVDETIEKVRHLSRDLSPSILEDLGLMAALRNLFTGVEEHYQLDAFSADIDELDPLFSPQASINIYRIFQEALTNIAKHARPTQVEVRARRENSQVAFSIEDNGVGFDIEEMQRLGQEKRGLGFATMEERVRSMGGTFHAESQPGRGTRINFTLPLMTSE
jgi:PAS domain S-box-containing protein